MKEHHDDKHPVTFGDCYKDVKGKKVPSDTVLTKKEEYFSEQCLDYFLQIIPC